MSDPMFQGPPQSYPEFDGWDEDRHKRAEKAIQVLDGIKMYKTAGGIGQGSKYKPAYVQLVQRGGITQDEASMLARYKIWRSGANTPKERVPEDTTEQIDARREELQKAAPERRAEMFKEADAHKDDSYTRFYDDLIGDSPKPQQPAMPPQAQNEPKKKTGGV